MIPDVRRVEHLGEMLRDALLTYNSNVAIFEADRHREVRRLSYAELLEEVETVAGYLQTELAAGERCAILMANQSRWVIGAMAGLFAGAVLVPLDYKLPVADLLTLLDRARPRVLVIDWPLYRDLQRGGLGDLAAQPSRILVAGVPEGAAAELSGPAVVFPDRDPGEAHRPCSLRPRSRQDVAAIVFSSGTGGVVKGCMLTHDSYLAQVQALIPQVPMEETDRYFSVLPTNHAIDFLCSVLMPYLYGAAVVYQRTLRAAYLASTMAAYEVTHTALVPRILKTMREEIEARIEEQAEWKRTLIRGLIDLNDLATLKTPNPRLSRTLLYPILAKFGGRLRMIFAGGAYVDPELATYFYRIGLPVSIGYGLTEACAVLTVNDLSPFRANTVGRPVAGVAIEVRQPDSTGVGEVYARGRTIMAGYVDAPELTAEVLQDGWLRTGDLGYIDAAGHLQLRGRAKNMVVTEGGKNVYPEEIEAYLDGVPCEELCVLAESYVWPSTGLSGSRLTAVVRPRTGQTQEEILDALRTRNQAIQDYKRLGSFVVCTQEFPVTASMKVKRAALAEQVRTLGLPRNKLT